MLDRWTCWTGHAETKGADPQVNTSSSLTCTYSGESARPLATVQRSNGSNRPPRSNADTPSGPSPEIDFDPTGKPRTRGRRLVALLHVGCGHRRPLLDALAQPARPVDKCRVGWAEILDRVVHSAPGRRVGPRCAEALTGNIGYVKLAGR